MQKEEEEWRKRQENEDEELRKVLELSQTEK